MEKCQFKDFFAHNSCMYVNLLQFLVAGTVHCYTVETGYQLLSQEILVNPHSATCYCRCGHECLYSRVHLVFTFHVFLLDTFY